MKKFVVERNLPGAACLTTDELQVISRLSCEAIVSLGQPYHWISSFITEDKIYCIHIAENEDVIREHLVDWSGYFEPSDEWNAERVGFLGHLVW